MLHETEDIFGMFLINCLHTVFRNPLPAKTSIFLRAVKLNFGYTEIEGDGLSHQAQEPAWESACTPHTGTLNTIDQTRPTDALSVGRNEGDGDGTNSDGPFFASKLRSPGSWRVAP